MRCLEGTSCNPNPPNSSSKQSPEDEAVTHIANKLMSDFQPNERINILREVQLKLLNDLSLNIEESHMRLAGHQKNMDEFQKAFNLVPPQTANKY